MLCVCICEYHNALAFTPLNMDMYCGASDNRVDGYIVVYKV